ncbi:MAG: type 1 glutamine amidotransferase [Acidimicrobiales bacterium]
MTRLLVIQHEDACPPDWFGEWLRADAVSLQVVLAHRGQAIPSRLRSEQGLLVLGGEMGANDDATVPWLPAVKDLIAATVDDERPFLGICLGHQLATVALGGEVTRNPSGRAKGLTPVALTEDGRGDALLGTSDGLPTIQWNGDVAVRLPEGSARLATGPDGSVQAARFGPRAWGVQFHPEASPLVFRGWTIAKISAARPPSPRLLAAVAAVDDAEAELQAAWRPLAQRFAQVVVDA